MRISTFLYWLPMIALAVANGSFRQFVLLKHMSSLSAHQISTAILVLLCTAYTFLVYNRLSIHSSGQALATGLTWVLLTVAFEFTMGRISKKPWATLLEDYNLLTGHVWSLFLLCLLLLPYVVFSIRK